MLCFLPNSLNICFQYNNTFKHFVIKDDVIKSVVLIKISPYAVYLNLHLQRLQSLYSLLNVLREIEVKRFSKIS